MIGPLELMALYFEDNGRCRKVLSELKTVRSGGLVRLLDVVTIEKNRSGDVAVIELSNMNAELKRPEPDEKRLGLFAQENVNLAAEQLPNNSGSALLLLEHSWLSGISDISWREAAVTLLNEHVSPDILARVERLRNCPDRVRKENCNES